MQAHGHASSNLNMGVIGSPTGRGRGGAAVVMPPPRPGPPPSAPELLRDSDDSLTAEGLRRVVRHVYYLYYYLRVVDLPCIWHV